MTHSFRNYKTSGNDCNFENVERHDVLNSIKHRGSKIMSEVGFNWKANININNLLLQLKKAGNVYTVVYIPVFLKSLQL